jgi:V8-like Glu-specific endopeptidase
MLGVTMNKEVGALIEAGGVWKHGVPGYPGHKLKDSDFEIKSVLPGISDRDDVPAPGQLPWRGVGLLNFFMQGNLVLVGSGFLCQPDVLITAKHNLTAKLYDAAGVWMGFDAERNSEVAPVGIRAFAVHVELDLAIFILDGPQAGAFDLGGEVNPANSEVTLAGFAFPYGNGSARYSYASGPAEVVDNSRLSYAINTRDGDSGAPVFQVVDGVAHVVGVHTNAAILPLHGNSGILISPLVVQDVLWMIAWARQQLGE